MCSPISFKPNLIWSVCAPQCHSTRSSRSIRQQYAEKSTTACRPETIKRRFPDRARHHLRCTPQQRRAAHLTWMPPSSSGCSGPVDMSIRSRKTPITMAVADGPASGSYSVTIGVLLSSNSRHIRFNVLVQTSAAHQCIQWKHSVSDTINAQVSTHSRDCRGSRNTNGPEMIQQPVPVSAMMAVATRSKSAQDPDHIAQARPPTGPQGWQVPLECEMLATRLHLQLHTSQNCRSLGHVT